MKNVNALAIIIIGLILFVLFRSNGIAENFWTYYTGGCRGNYTRGARQLSGRCRDNFFRHFTHPRWMAKDEHVPAFTPYYDYEEFYPSGILTHTAKPTLSLTLFSEKRLSGGGVIFKYKYGIVHFASVHGGSPGTTIPFQTKKDLNTGDVITIPGYAGQFRVTIQERGPGVADLPYPYTFQPNVI